MTRPARRDPVDRLGDGWGLPYDQEAQKPTYDPHFKPPQPASPLGIPYDPFGLGAKEF